METIQVAQESTDVQFIGSQSQVSHSTLDWEKACKYCEKHFNNKLIMKKHVAVCQKLYCEKCNSIFETQRNIQIILGHVMTKHLCASHATRN